MNAPTAFPDQQKPVPPYKHTPLFPLGADTTPYKKVTTEGVRVEKVLGKDMLVVSREALRALSEAAPQHPGRSGGEFERQVRRAGFSEER